jgi:integrase
MGIYRQRKSKFYWMSKTIDGIPYRKSTETNSKMEARAVFERWATELKTSLLPKPKAAVVAVNAPVSAVRFSDLAEKYKEWITGRQKGVEKRYSVIKILFERFGNKELSRISINDIEQLQTDMLKTNHAISYINKLTSVLKAIYTKAADWEMITESDLLRIRKVKQLKGEVARLRYLSEEEIVTLLSNCDVRLRAIVATALNTGMRRSELFGLTWDRVDLRNGVILLDKTKNGERREIPINETLRQTLNSIVRRIDIPYVFFNPDTLKKYSDSGIKRSFQTALRKSNIRDFTFHDLRHTFASRLVMAGADIASVQKLLGHKSIKMTLRYAHLSNVHLKTAVAVLDKKIHTFFIPDEKKENMKT